MDKGVGLSIGEIAEKLVIYDIEKHKEPLFSDLNEQSQQHTHAMTNAFKFLASQLDSINGRRFNNRKLYSTLYFGGYVTEEEKKLYEIGVGAKFDSKGNLKGTKSRRIKYEWE